MEMFFEQDVREQAVMEVARKMASAARTAPKARGVDNLEILITGREGIQKISEKLKQIAERGNVMPFFLRDANNILSAQVMLILGTRIKSLGIEPCSMCGFKNCEEKNQYPDHPCAFNTGDLGIAIGSAVSVAMDNRVDNRVMYSVGKAVLEMGLLGEGVKIAYGIPLSVGSKNPFFDRKQAVK